MSMLHKEDRIEMYDYHPHDEQILPIEAQMLNVNLIRLAQYLKLDIGFVDRTQSLQGNDPGNTDMVALDVALGCRLQFVYQRLLLRFLFC